MNSISFSNNLHWPSGFSQHIMNPLRDSLSARQKVIATMATTIFAVAVLALAVYRYLRGKVSLQKPDESLKLHTKESKAPLQPIHIRVLQGENLSRNSSDHRAGTFVDSKKAEDNVQISDKDLTMTPDLVEDQDLFSTKEPQSIVDEFQSSDDVEYQFDGDGDLFDEYSIDGHYIDDAEEASSEDSDELKSSVGIDNQTTVIDGKSYSRRTLKCLEKLDAYLEEMGKVRGTAIDNGCCFFDSFAQGLSRLLGRPISLQELRKQVSEEVKRLDAGPESENWVKQMIDKEYIQMDTYEDYRDRVGYDTATIQELGHSAPVWGQERRDGVILCRLYQVNLVVYGAGCIDERLSALNNPDNFYTDEQTYPKGETFEKTIEMAIYPGHFMPVRDKAD